MKLKLRFAEKIDVEKIVKFFAKYISENTPGIINREFLCPDGIMWAILRKQLIIVLLDNNIFGALRFYPQKKNNIVSVYQFALEESIRSKDIIKKMLKFTGYNIFHSKSYINSDFNNYYIKQNWNLIKTDSKYNYWELII